MKPVVQLLLVPLALSACGGSSDGGDPPPSPAANESTAAAATGERASSPAESTPAQSTAADPMSPALASTTTKTATPAKSLSCEADIGAVAAARLVETCRNVSPATHPPCNAANSCAMIEDEIARSCALFDGDGKPMKGCTVAPTGVQAAAAVVKRYYAAINARDFSTAWQQWGDDGQPARTYAAFERGFADTRGVKVTIGHLQPGEGAAGSVYQPVPVTVDTTMADGSHQRFAGRYVVRRVNGVDGATPDQLRWHIGSATLKRMPAS